MEGASFSKIVGVIIGVFCSIFLVATEKQACIFSHLCCGL